MCSAYRDLVDVDRLVLWVELRGSLLGGEMTVGCAVHGCDGEEVAIRTRIARGWDVFFSLLLGRGVKTDVECLIVRFDSR